MTNDKIVDQRGSFIVEMLLLVPVMIITTLVIVHVGRVVVLHGKVSHAADSAARAASLVSTGRHQQAARSTAVADLDGRGARCRRLSVSTGRTRWAGVSRISVRVRCTSDIGGLSLLGVRSVTVDAESTEYVDVYTQRD